MELTAHPPPQPCSYTLLVTTTILHLACLSLKKNNVFGLQLL